MREKAKEIVIRREKHTASLPSRAVRKLWNCGKAKKPMLKLHKTMDSVGGGMFNKGRKVFLWLSSGGA